MIVLRRIFHGESDRDFLVKTVDLAVSEISFDIEYETVNRRRQLITGGQEIVRSSIAVGFLTSDGFPPAIMRLAIEPYKDPGRGPADRYIKNVCCYSAHSDKSFLSRISVIFFCSFAAMAISVSRSLPSRDRQSSSISSALFPVAQTMKINPNFS